MAANQSPEPTHDQLLNNIHGTIYGNCIGDTIGLLTEFMTKKQAHEIYGEHSELEFKHKVPDMHRQRWKIGDWTDDSDQMILIMQSLVDNNGKVDVVDYGKRLLHWARRGFSELGDHVGMGIGSTTSNVLRHKSYATDPHSAAEDIWRATGMVVAPNGGVMRTSVVGIYQFQDLAAVRENATQYCKVTHADPRCVASCVAVTMAIALMLQGRPPYLAANEKYDVDAIIKDCYKVAKTCLRGKNVRTHKKELKQYMFCTNIKDLKLDDKNAIGFTYKCMGSGFWALKQDDFRTAMQALVFEGGDADTNGAVAGAMLGCKLGANKLPESWLMGLLHKEWLDGHIQSFLKLIPQLDTAKEETKEKDAENETDAHPT